MAALANIFDKLKSKFDRTSPSDLEVQSDIKASLDNNKTITMKAPKSERYTFLPGLTGKANENFHPETKEEKDTLSPIGFFRVGEKQAERQKQIQERIKAAASLMGVKEDELTEDQQKLVKAQAERENMLTQDIPSTAIKKLKYDPKTEELWVTFQGSSKKYWYPRVPKEKVQELMEAPSKGEYFLRNIHDQYSVNYQLHGTHSSERNKKANRQIRNYYKKMRRDYAKGRKQGTMQGVLNNGRS